jgi:hypothetical protein
MCFLILSQKRIVEVFPTRGSTNWHLTNSVAQEPESSSPHSQQPATSPYPESVYFNPHPAANLPKIFHVPNLMFIFRFLSFAKESVLIRGCV